MAFLLLGAIAASTGCSPAAGPRDAGPPGTDAQTTEGTCDDRLQNGSESATDCGGTCPGCQAGLPCAINEDCASSICGIRLTCVAATCLDRVYNGTESDVDCGGDDCAPCPNERACRDGSDCASTRCQGGVCTGSLCVNLLRDGDETDVDCGGSECPACSGGQRCETGSDCDSTTCLAAGTCAAATCEDDLVNQGESDLDCGGPCDGCADGLMCGGGADCQSLSCSDGTCVAPTCDDGILNGGELGVDCRGPCAAQCGVGASCVEAADCLDGVCGDAGTCSAPACDDSVTNGAETDVDCGGATACPRCADGRACTDASDCVADECSRGTCGSGVTFVGYSNWTQSCSGQTDAQQDAIMNAACSALFAGSRAATVGELVSGLIVGMPANNTSGGYLIPACPSCEGSVQVSCASGHARLCVNPSAAWPVGLPWTGYNFCYSSSRTAMCVR